MLLFIIFYCIFIYISVAKLLNLRFTEVIMSNFSLNIPIIKEAEQMLEEASILFPGLWVQHSIYVGQAASYIAKATGELDGDTAMVLGLLHDIGRRSKSKGMRHSIAGYNFLKEKGYDLPAQICMTHSFPYQDIKSAFGDWDCSEEEYKFAEEYIKNIEYTGYDKLIQLCDAIALPQGFCLMEKRMVDVAIRHGLNDFIVPKWKSTFEIKNYFEEKIGKSIYSLLPCVVENTFSK